MFNKKFGMLIDVDRCTGCQACQVACKQEYLSFVNHPIRGAIRVHQVGPYGTFPNLQMHFIPSPCQHCEDPACLKICPENAMTKNEDGIVLIDYDKCSLCHQCISACPFQALEFNDQTDRVEKCTFCVHRLMEGQIPACVLICPAKAMTFGDLNDPYGEISRQIEEKRSWISCLPTPDGKENRSRIFYLRIKGMVKDRKDPSF